MGERTDRELLELAAKAAGINWRNWTPTMFSGETELREWPHDWNPLADDGDALRLAVKLQIDVKQYGDHVAAWFEGGYIGTGCIPYDNDPCAATRRAITLAAAAIGSAIESGEAP